jgi:hypothetical protein
MQSKLQMNIETPSHYFSLSMIILLSQNYDYMNLYSARRKGEGTLFFFRLTKKTLRKKVPMHGE